jgi:hypothetical protein
MGVFDLLAKGAKKAGPFFSRVDEALESLKREKGTPEEFLREIEKQPGVKKAEIEDRGLKKAVAAKAPQSKKPITKEAMRKILQESPPPRVQEKTLVEKSPDYDEFLEEQAVKQFGVDYWELSNTEKQTLRRMYDEMPVTKYEQYKTPGGENYREILLKLPQRGLTPSEQNELMLYEAYQRRGTQFLPERQARYDELKSKESAGAMNYQSSHWQGEPNVLAHIRVQDFKTPEGKKVLLVDEIQSDWHQAGRKKGYSQQFAVIGNKGERKFVGTKDQAEEFLGKSTDSELFVAPVGGSGVPDAPFKKNWHELAMKRVLDYAAENGYDSIAITPGAEQAKRYDLSKQVRGIDWSEYDGRRGANKLITIEPTAGNLIELPIDESGKVIQGLGTQFDGKSVDEIVGKEIASKIMTEKYGSLAGEGLQIGGEGMKGFYDKILPDYLNTFGRQYGSGVRQMELPLGYTEESKRLINDAFARGSMADSDLAVKQAQMQMMPVHAFDITPQLREQVKTKGLPLYSRIGMGPEGLAAGTGAATIGATQEPEQPEQQVQNPVHFTENPDAMRLELMQRN